MNAKDALAETNAALVRKAKEETAQKDSAKKAMDLKIATALEKEVPFAVTEIMKKVAEAAMKGKYSTTWTFSKDEVGRAILHGVRAALEKKGFHISSEYYSYTDDYGDSAAPCTVHHEGFEMTVSWDKK